MQELEVAVIGGSAGALDALLVIVTALPATFAVPIVVVLHVLPDQPSRLPHVLGRACKRRVVEIEDKQPLARDTVHVAPPNYHVLVETSGVLSLSIDERVHFARPSIDVLFESAADGYGPAAAGVLLSGGNEDGARGLVRIAKAGGHALVQAPDSAPVPHMPELAIAWLAGRGHVAAPAELAARLIGLTEGRS